MTRSVNLRSDDVEAMQWNRWLKQNSCQILWWEQQWLVSNSQMFTTGLNAPVRATALYLRSDKDRLSGSVSGNSSGVERLGQRFPRKKCNWHIRSLYKCDWGIIKGWMKVRLIPLTSTPHFTGLFFFPNNSSITCHKDMTRDQSKFG